jgi:tetratricopeptide (TPR) repeat protein
MNLRRPTLLFVLLAGISFPAVAQNDDKREIVVTARSLKDTENDLKACLARGCPPDEDIKATLAHAENQFVEGDYRNARETLAKSLGRNRKHKGQYPIEVSDLLRANGNVAIHLGEADIYRLSVLDMRDTLKSALKPDDYRVFGAEIEVADSRMKLGYYDEASDKYLQLEKQALTKNLPQVAAIARLRDLSLRVQRAETEKTEFRKKEAVEAIDEFLLQPRKDAEQFKIVAEVLKSRMDRNNGNSETTDKLIARYAALGGTDRPLLLHSKPIEMNEAQAARAAAGGSDLNRIGTQVVEKRWVDIGFWIGADGKVDEPEILRSQGDTKWTDVVLKSIKTRIYAPLKAEKDGTSPGIYAIERYSLTAQYEDDVTGTRIRQRSPVAKIERIDLTS